MKYFKKKNLHKKWKNLPIIRYQLDSDNSF